MNKNTATIKNLMHPKMNLILGFSSLLIIAFIGFTVLNSTPVRAENVIQVYKNKSCGCCGRWVEHLEASGFKVEVTAMDDVRPIKEENGIPSALAACHTAKIDGYYIEGHVPAADIKQLLKDKPDIAGLAVPGMPSGSPGMEMPGRAAVSYDVLSVKKDGSSSVFKAH